MDPIKVSREAFVWNSKRNIDALSKRSKSEYQMKKSRVLFVIFLILNILFRTVLYATLGPENYPNLFLPILSLEIAVYGSFILYEMSKSKKDDK